VHSRYKENDELILRKIRKEEILGNDKRFNEYRKGKSGNYRASIAITESDNEWLKETGMGQYAVTEKTELFRLQAEVSERVKQRKAGLASILDF
jgi:hypothetical protein